MRSIDATLRQTLVVILLAGSTAAGATEWPARVTAKPEKAAAPISKSVQPAPASAAPQSIYLVRATLLTLHDANRSGNYTVLRDLASPGFRDRNSAADLAQTFAELRRGSIDLGIAALLDPLIDGAPLLDPERRLRLKGEFATKPNRLLFELAFEDVRGRWQLHDISLATAPQTAGRR